MMHRRWTVAVSIVIGVSCAVWPKSKSPVFVWNASQSVPIGLYVITSRHPSRGELAMLRLPEQMRNLADARRYLPANTFLIKPVAALSSDHVCRHGEFVTINGYPAARASDADASGRPLPQWSGCHGIDKRQFLVLSDEPNSFDGRYFGLVDARHVIGTATSVIVLPYRLLRQTVGERRNLSSSPITTLP